MKKTPWFCASVKPVRVGYYEVKRYKIGRTFPGRTTLLWSGSSWQHTEHSSAGMFPGSRAEMSKHDGDKWRGLLKEAK